MPNEYREQSISRGHETAETQVREENRKRRHSVADKSSTGTEEE